MRVNLREWISSQQGKHFCHCGCGQPIKISRHHHARGIPRFINGHVSRVSNSMSGRSGDSNPNYKGGRYVDHRGYVLILNETREGPQYRFEHRLVMEAHLGRPLRSDEHVLHINRDKADNRIENLRALTAAEHSALHQQELQHRMGRKAYMKAKRNINKGLPYKEALPCTAS